MGNPTMSALSDSEANSHGSGAPHAGTGIAYIPVDISEDDSPPIYTRMIQLFHHLMEHLGPANQGRVIDVGGLNVGCFALAYSIGATEHSYAGDATFALTADETNYLYLDTDAVLEKSITGWPGTDHVKLAKAVCDGTSITSIEDSRAKNYRIGSLTNWWEFPPSAAVDLNDQWLNDVGRLKFSDPADVTLSVDGKVTPPTTSAWLRLDTYGGGVADNFEDFNTDYPASTYGQVVIISAKDAARVVTVKAAGATVFKLINGDCVLDDPDKFLVLIGNDDEYVEWFRNETALTQLNADLNVNEKRLDNVGMLNLNAYDPLEIASGVVTISRMWTKLLNESGDPTDDLNTISGGTSGDLLILQARSGGQVPTVMHGTGNIELANDRDYELSDTARVLLLQYDGSTWREISRSHPTIFDLSGTGKGLRWEPTHYIPETLVLNTTYSPQIYVNVETVVEKIVANVVTAPSGGPCVVQLLDDGAPIATATIADGATQAISSVVAATVAAGSILQFRTTTINAADGLSVTTLGRRDVPSSAL